MHKKAVLKLASGFRGRAGNCIRIARERVERALQYATRDRRAKKRDVRSLWIARINAGAREHGVSCFSSFFWGPLVLPRRLCDASARKREEEFDARKIWSAENIGIAAVDVRRLGIFFRSHLFFAKKKKKTLSLQLTYSTFIAGLKAENIALNRKILSDFAEKEPLSFGALAARVRALQEKGGAGGVGGSKAGASGGVGA